MIFRFERYALATDTRELSDGEAVLRVPRRVFDAIEYLLINRDRAVSKDELIQHLWHRSNVSDLQLSQLLVTARRVLNDDGQQQRIIRTVPGFGYRWAIATEASTPAAPVAVLEASPPPADSVQQPVSSSAEAPLGIPGIATAARSPRPVRALLFSLLIVALGIAAAALVFDPAATRTSAELRIAVLPADAASGDANAMRMRLGLADLIARRLREGGVIVTPMDNVLALLRTGRYPSAAHQEDFKSQVHADLVLESRVSATVGGWDVQLFGRRPNGLRFAITATAATPVDAARNAATRALDALGRPTPHHDATDVPGLQEIVQRARGAALMNEFDAARFTLANAPAEVRQHPTARVEAALVELRSGQLAAAESQLLELLEDLGADAPAAVRANALLTLGSVELRQERFQDAQSHYRAALGLLGTEHSHPIMRGEIMMGLGTSHGALRQFPAAATELMRAKDLLEYSGDWLAVARVEAQMGALQIAQHRFADALPQLQRAATQFEAYGAVDDWVIAIADVLDARRALLHWSDGIEASDQVARLVAQVADPTLLARIQSRRADIMLGSGRLKEAAALWRAAHVAGSRGHAVDQHLQIQQAELALMQGDASGAAQLAQAVLQAPSHTLPAHHHDRAALTYIRAVRQSRPGNDADLQLMGLTGITPTSPSANATRTAAHAEWLLSRDATAGESLLGAALSAVPHPAIPADQVALAQTLTDHQLAQHRLDDRTRTMVAELAPWADQDFAVAVLRARVYLADGVGAELQTALTKVQRLAGERPLPAELEAAIRLRGHLLGRGLDPTRKSME